MTYRWKKLDLPHWYSVRKVPYSIPITSNAIWLRAKRRQVEGIRALGGTGWRPHLQSSAGWPLAEIDVWEEAIKLCRWACGTDDDTPQARLDGGNWLPATYLRHGRLLKLCCPCLHSCHIRFSFTFFCLAVVHFSLFLSLHISSFCPSTLVAHLSL